MMMSVCGADNPSRLIKLRSKDLIKARLSHNDRIWTISVTHSADITPAHVGGYETASLRTRSHSVTGLAFSGSSLLPRADPDGRQHEDPGRKIEEPDESGMLR